MLGPRETRAILEKHGLRPRTSWGQHFVTDPNTVRKIVRLAGIEPGTRVVEVGPGLGALTLALCDAGARVIAVERDRLLEPVLAEVLEGRDVTLVFEDALRVDWKPLLGRGHAVMVANLPYQVATPLVLDLLEDVPQIRSYVVMVQREVGERLAAGPGEDAYGAVSAKVAWYAEASVASRISRRVFFPMPEVESVVVRLERRARPPVAGSRDAVFGVIEAGFAQRRKTIRNALRSRWPAEAVEGALARAGVEPSARAETLGLPEFAALARALGTR